MDTICLFKLYTPYENPSPYIALEKAPAPSGCKAWRTALKDSGWRICWIKIQCHELIGESLPAQRTLDKLREIVTRWLAVSGFTLDDFTLSRIDYDYNFYLPYTESEVLLDTMQQLSYRIQRMNKWNSVRTLYYTDPSRSGICSLSKMLKQDREDDPSVYYMNKSRHAQLYLKDKERENKGYAPQEDEIELCRQEVQCHAGRIKYMRRQHGIDRTWDRWVTPEMEAKYLIEAEPVFPLGDFYTLDGAIDIINASSLTPCYKKRLAETLLMIQQESMDALKSAYSRNTIKNYLAKLKALNINPLTIVPNEHGIEYLANPFFAARVAGRTA